MADRSRYEHKRARRDRERKLATRIPMLAPDSCGSPARRSRCRPETSRIDRSPQGSSPRGDQGGPVPIADPAESVSSPPGQADLRDHLEANIQPAPMLDLTTEKGGSPYTLVCTKNTGIVQGEAEACRGIREHWRQSEASRRLRSRWKSGEAYQHSELVRPRGLWVNRRTLDRVLRNRNTAMRRGRPN